MDDSTAVQVSPSSALVTSPALPELLNQAPTSVPTPTESSTTRRPRGRPLEVSWVHLWMGLLTCALQGMKSYQDWWRLMCSQPVGSFAPVNVTDDALIKRLRQAGLEPLSQLLTTVAARLAPRLAALSATTLAPFA